MTYQMATRALKKAEKSGYTRYHSGIVSNTERNRQGRIVTHYGINIDGNPFGCPATYWTVQSVNDLLGCNYKIPGNETYR